MEFYRLEPWGADIDWFRMGTLAAMIANTAPNRKKSAKMFKPQDFIPQYDKPTDGLNPVRIKAEFLSGFGDRIKYGKDDAGGN